MLLEEKYSQSQMSDGDATGLVEEEDSSRAVARKERRARLERRKEERATARRAGGAAAALEDTSSGARFGIVGLLSAAAEAPAEAIAIAAPEETSSESPFGVFGIFSAAAEAPEVTDTLPPSLPGPGDTSPRGADSVFAVEAPGAPDAPLGDVPSMTRHASGDAEGVQVVNGVEHAVGERVAGDVTASSETRHPVSEGVWVASASKAFDSVAIEKIARTGLRATTTPRDLVALAYGGAADPFSIAAATWLAGPPRGAEGDRGDGSGARILASSANNFALPPAFALALLPSLARGELTSSSKANEDVAGLPGAPSVAFAAQAALDARFYRQEWEHAVSSRDPGPPLAPLAFSYEQICAQVLGPAALTLGGTVSVQDFKKSLLSGCLEYRVQEVGVATSRTRPDYLSFAPPLSDASAQPSSPEALERLEVKLEANRKVRSALQKDISRLKNALPRWRPGGLGFAGGGDLQKEAARRGSIAPESFATIRLAARIFEAKAVPQAKAMHNRAPYVVVSVVDGDPLGLEAAARGDAEQARAWYSEREQSQRRTNAAVGETDHPVWNAALDLGAVRPSPGFFVHLRLMNEDEYTSDQGVGQAAVPLVDVLRHSWFGARSIALVPFDRRVQERWAELADTRLTVALQWEPPP